MSSNDILNQISETDSRNGKKATRFTFSESAKKKLELYFSSNPYPTVKQREALAIEINISEKHIRYWFQNYRNKQRKEGKIERLLSAPKTDTSKQTSSVDSFLSSENLFLENSNDSNYSRNNDSSQCSSSVSHFDSNSNSIDDNYPMVCAAPFISQFYNYLGYTNTYKDANKQTGVKISKPLFRPYE